MRILTFAILLALAISISACGTEPTPEQVFESPLAPPTAPVTVTAERVAPTTLPSPQPDKGAVTGQFMDSATGEPVAERVLYLGELNPLKTQEGEEASNFIMMVPSTSPSAMTDQDGYFAFVDVEPSTYAFVLWTPVDSWVAVNPATEKNILIAIKAGEIIDLGTVPILTSR